MTDTPKTYDLSTLADVYAYVPADRIEACLCELGAHLAKLKRESPGGMTLKLPLVWTDDGIKEQLP